MREKILEFYYSLQSFLCKNHCVWCKQQINFSICSNCFQNIIINDFKPIRIYNNVHFYSAAKYDGVLRKAIHSIKFSKNTSISYELTKILFNYWKNIELSSQYYEVIPVPAHRSKIKARGYNHMEIIGKQFVFLSNYKLNNRLIKRTKDTLPQYKLSLEERKLNLHNAFNINPKFFNGNSLLLIDDIVTSGATMQELINSLNSVNINKICVLTLSDVDLTKYSI